MTDNDDKVQQFITVTGAEANRATFFLESSNWDMDSAVSRFLDGDIPTEDSDDIQTIEDSPPPKAPLNTATSTVSQSIKAKSKPHTKANTRFATLKTLDTSSDDDEEDGQAFYAGGSEHSGQQVLGPSKKKKDFVADMFKSVKDNGVEVIDSDNGSGPSSGHSRFFRGTGYKLGQNENDTEVVSGPETSPGQTAVNEVSMKMWRDGFSVEDGPLRQYTDPSNRDFMESVRHGEIPMELRQGATEINLSMEDHRGEAYKPSPNLKLLKAFTGKGHTLGNPTPPTVGAPDIVDQPINEAHARELIVLNPNQPTTNLQIRLADGTRLLGEFNHEHTIAQVRLYILAARPQYETRPFSLLTTYPSRVLEDEQTIKEAGILHSAIMQKLN